MTTRAGLVEKELSAVRFCPYEWMDVLGIDYDEDRMRAEIEALQWGEVRNGC